MEFEIEPFFRRSFQRSGRQEPLALSEILAEQSKDGALRLLFSAPVSLPAGKIDFCFIILLGKSLAASSIAQGVGESEVPRPDHHRAPPDPDSRGRYFFQEVLRPGFPGRRPSGQRDVWPAASRA